MKRLSEAIFLIFIFSLVFAETVKEIIREFKHTSECAESVKTEAK